MQDPDCARVHPFITSRAAGSMKDEEARRKALSWPGFEGRPAFHLRQVHGTEIVAVRSSVPPSPAPEADGWITNVPGVVLCVFVADCMPICMWEKSGKAIGIFHAGWRGLAKGMVSEAVKAFQTHYGIEAKDLDVRIGPHIGKCCYRVGPETAEQFRPQARIEREGGIYLDLVMEAAMALVESGVDSMSADGRCTSCENDKFFSFRREKTDSRMMAFITLDPK
ncbi:MAG: peptidoglycan editing factor PgeF [Elusimicrobia bacterium]|nr:peptidoglycan editing factor PgeF [Elusimicrobiota bacterium]